MITPLTTKYWCAWFFLQFSQHLLEIHAINTPGFRTKKRWVRGGLVASGWSRNPNGANVRNQGSSHRVDRRSSSPFTVYIIALPASLFPNRWGTGRSVVTVRVDFGHSKHQFTQTYTWGPAKTLEVNGTCSFIKDPPTKTVPMIIISPTLLESLVPAAIHIPNEVHQMVFFFLFQMLHVWITVFANMISVKHGNIMNKGKCRCW